VAPMGVKFGTEKGIEDDKGIGPTKLKFLLIFDQNVEYKRHERAYPLRVFHNICRFCTHFRMR